MAQQNPLQLLSDSYSTTAARVLDIGNILQIQQADEHLNLLRQIHESLQAIQNDVQAIQNDVQAIQNDVRTLNEGNEAIQESIEDISINLEDIRITSEEQWLAFEIRQRNSATRARNAATLRLEPRTQLRPLQDVRTRNQIPHMPRTHRRVSRLSAAEADRILAALGIQLEPEASLAMKREAIRQEMV
jgi:hypothetical protein